MADGVYAAESSLYVWVICSPIGIGRSNRSIGKGVASAIIVLLQKRVAAGQEQGGAGDSL